MIQKYWITHFVIQRKIKRAQWFYDAVRSNAFTVNDNRSIIIVQEPAAQKPMLSSTRKKPLFYGRVEVGESNDPYLPELKWCISQKLIPPVVDS